MVDDIIEAGKFDGPEGMEKVVAVLTACHLDSHGGYEYDYVLENGRLYIAGLDHSKNCKTKLQIYEEDLMREWERRARAYRNQNDCDWIEAVYETQ